MCGGCTALMTLKSPAYTLGSEDAVVIYNFMNIQCYDLKDIKQINT